MMEPGLESIEAGFLNLSSFLKSVFTFYRGLGFSFLKRSPGFPEGGLVVWIPHQSCFKGLACLPSGLF